jgi:hypothetical protein
MQMCSVVLNIRSADVFLDIAYMSFGFRGLTTSKLELER